MLGIFYLFENCAGEQRMLESADPVVVQTSADEFVPVRDMVPFGGHWTSEPDDPTVWRRCGVGRQALSAENAWQQLAGVLAMSVQEFFEMFLGAHRVRIISPDHIWVQFREASPAGAELASCVLDSGMEPARILGLLLKARQAAKSDPSRRDN